MYPFVRVRITVSPSLYRPVVSVFCSRPFVRVRITVVLRCWLRRGFGYESVSIPSGRHTISLVLVSDPARSPPTKFNSGFVAVSDTSLSVSPLVEPSVQFGFRRGFGYKSVSIPSGRHTISLVLVSDPARSPPTKSVPVSSRFRVQVCQYPLRSRYFFPRGSLWPFAMSQLSVNHLLRRFIFEFHSLLSVTLIVSPTVSLASSSVSQRIVKFSAFAVSR